MPDNTTDRDADYSVDNPGTQPLGGGAVVAYSAASTFVGSTMMLGGCLWPRIDTLVAIGYVFAVLGVIGVFYGLRLIRVWGICSPVLGRRPLPAHSHDPCPLSWPLNARVIFYDMGTDNVLAVSAPITHSTASVALRYGAGEYVAEKAEGTAGFYVEVTSP